MREHYVRRPENEALMQQSLRAVEKKQLPHMLCTTNMLLHDIEDPSFVRHDNTLARPYISYANQDRVDIVLTNPPFGGKEEAGIESNFPRHFQTKETADLFLALIMRLLKPGGRAGMVLPDGSLFGEGVKTRLKGALMEECNLHTIVRLPNSVFRPYASIGTNLLFFEKGRPTVGDSALGEQLDRYRRLGATAATVQHGLARLEITFGTDIDVDLLDETVAIERGCCSFFTLFYDTSARRLSIGIDDPARADALAALASALRDATPAAAR